MSNKEVTSYRDTILQLNLKVKLPDKITYFRFWSKLNTLSN